MKKEIRPLRADEILVRVERINPKTLVGELVLYKDARCDQRILDETFGLRWKRTHKIVNNMNYCTISVWDDEINQWIDREDVGVAQNFEREKSAASDAFKRAGFNFGIGRELYTTPADAAVQLSPAEVETGRDGNIYMRNDVQLFVHEINYTDHRITKLIIIDAAGQLKYMYPFQAQQSQAQLNALQPQQPNGNGQQITLQVHVPPVPQAVPSYKKNIS